MENAQHLVSHLICLFSVKYFWTVVFVRHQKIQWMLFWINPVRCYKFRWIYIKCGCFGSWHINVQTQCIWMCAKKSKRIYLAYNPNRSITCAGYFIWWNKFVRVNRLQARLLGTMHTRHIQTLDVYYTDPFQWTWIFTVQFWFTAKAASNYYGWRCSDSYKENTTSKRRRTQSIA